MSGFNGFYNLVASLPPRKNIFPIPSKDSFKIGMELFPWCAISPGN